MMERPVLSVGSCASFWKPGCDVRTGLITCERVTPGIPAKQFVVHDWGTWEEIETYACWLRPVAEIPVDLSGEWLTEDPTGQPVGPAEADGGPPGQLNEGQTRFPSLSCDDLDALAAQRTSANTKEQTRWGVKVFTGEWWWISVTKWFVD